MPFWPNSHQQFDLHFWHLKKKSAHILLQKELSYKFIHSRIGATSSIRLNESSFQAHKENVGNDGDITDRLTPSRSSETGGEWVFTLNKAEIYPLDHRRRQYYRSAKFVNFMTTATVRVILDNLENVA